MKNKLKISISKPCHESGEMMTLNQNGKFCADSKKKNSVWILMTATIIALLGIGNQEIKAQETVKIELTENTTTDSAQIKPRKGTKNFIGTVYDENRNPLPGATISIKNYKTKTNTNSNGEFSIMAKKGDILEFFYIGFQPFELKLKDETSLKIYLKIDTSTSNEVVKIKFKKE